MKNLLKTSLLSAIIAVSFSSCSTDDKVIDGVFDGVASGAVLRTIAVTSNEIPAGVDASQFTVEIEEQDAQDGDLLASVDVYITYTDNSPDGGDSTGAAGGEVLYTTIPASDFVDGPFGLPRYTLNITAPEFANAVGITTAGIFGADTFRTRLALNLTDGRTFSVDETASVVTGGFFASPFQYITPVVCPVNDGTFVGDYLAEQVAPSIFGYDTFDPDGGGEVITLHDANTAPGAGLAQPAEVAALPSTQRAFDADYLAALGFGNTLTYIFDLVCGEVVVPTGQTTGLTCGGAGITLGPPAGTAGVYDFMDDMTFAMVFRDDEIDDCGGGVDASINWTKQ